MMLPDGLGVWPPEWLGVWPPEWLGVWPLSVVLLNNPAIPMHGEQRHPRHSLPQSPSHLQSPQSQLPMVLQVG